MKLKQQNWSILITAMFASFMNPFMLAAVNIALPDIQEQFQCSASMLSWVSNSFLLANAIILLPASKAADTWGRVRFFKSGLVIFTVFTLLAAFSPNIEILLINRILQGAGAALMHVTSIAILTAAFPAEKRGMVLGINIGAVYTGLSLGPFLGGMLTQWGGWSSIFYAVVPLGLAASVLASFSLDSDKKPGKHSTFDYPGSVIYALAIFGFIYGGSQIKSLHGSLVFIVGIVALIGFFYYEKKPKMPIFNGKMLKENRRFAFSNYAALIHYASTFGTGFLLSLYLQFSKGLSPGEAGLVLVVQPVIMAITAPLTGRLSDRIDAGKLASLGMALTLIGLIALVFLESSTSIAQITGILVFLGLGFGFFTSPNTNVVMSSVEKKDYGIASGLNATMRVFGQTISMMVATLFLSLYFGKLSISPDNVDLLLKSMKVYFILFGVLCIPGIWFSVKR